MRGIRLGSFVLGIALLASVAHAGEFRPLFNGKNLDGWVVDGPKTDKSAKTIWSVADGLIVCQGTAFGFLRYEKQQFDDFVMRVEYRFAPAAKPNQHGNSGLGIRTIPFDPKESRLTRPSYASYEIQLLDDAGKKPDAHGTGSLYRYLAPKANVVKPAPEWNVIEVECVGPRIKVRMNGQEILDADQTTLDDVKGKPAQAPAPKDKPLRGYLALQSHSGKIEFRKVEVRELSGGEAKINRLDYWPHWRGPLANGTAPHADPPVSWDAHTNIRWKVPLPGRGSATPIVWGDQVFVVTAIKTNHVATAEELPKVDPALEKKTTAPMNYYRFEVYSFDRQTGKLRWRQVAAEKVPHEGHHPSHSYAAGSPTTDGRFLYVSFGSFGIYCYDLEGKLQWQRDLGRLSTRLGWGEAVTPVVRGDALLLNWDQEVGSALICLDARTGQDRWRVERDEKTSWNTPLVVEHKGRTQVIVNATKRARAYDLATGAPLWQVGGMTTNAIPSPVAAGGVAYCMSGYQGAGAVAVPLDSTGDLGTDGSVLWRLGKGTPYVPSPLLAGDRLYFTQANNALLTIVDVKSGQVLLDRARLPGVQSFYASPVAAAGRIYLVDRAGTTLVLRQSDQLEVLATNRLDDPIDASPVAVGKQLFLRGERFLYCIEAE